MTKGKVILTVAVVVYGMLFWAMLPIFIAGWR